MLAFIVNILISIEAWYTRFKIPVAPPVPDPLPPQPTPPPMVTPPQPPPTPAPKYDWSTPAAGRHSVRVICDELGFSLKDKNEMTATIGVESAGCWMSYYPADYHIFALRGTPIKRENISNGKVWSTDWGICQWNDYYHGKEMPPDTALNDPEAAVRLMAHYWAMGEVYRAWWVAYKTGAYKQYL